MLVGFIITVITLSDYAVAEEPLIDCTTCHEKNLDIHILDDGCYSCHNNDMTSLNYTRIITSEYELKNTNCEECHEDKYIELENEEHGRLGFTCEDCHDPHSTDTEVEITKRIETIKISDSELLCESCHKVTYSLWEQGSHEDSELGCTSCHDPHEDSAQIRPIVSLSGFPIILMGIEGIGVGVLLVIISQIMYFLFRD